MSTITGTYSKEKGVTAFVRNHPLIVYFFLAYARMWAVSAPPAGVNEYMRVTL